MKRLFSLLCLTLFFFTASPAWAKFVIGPGATGASFLKVQASARPAALSGAFSAVSGDVASLDTNPAGLGHLSRRDFSFSHINYLEDTTLQSLSFGFPAFKSQQPNSQGTKIFLGGQYRVFKAEDEQRNLVGAKYGSFDLKDQLVQLAGAYALKETVLLGLAGKLIYQSIQDESITNFAGDAGVIWNILPHSSLGASIINVGTSEAFLKESDPLPLTTRFGGTFQLKKVLFLADISLGRDNLIQPAGALEWDLARFVQFRFGTNYHQTWEFSGGLGLKINPTSRPSKNTTSAPDASFSKLETANSKKNRGLQFGIDYAAQTKSDLGLSHTFTIKILY